MRKTWSQKLARLARILGILFALFLSLFAFDVFETEGSIWENIGGFLIHLVPTYLVLIAVAIGWRWPWLGGFLFFALGALYLVISPVNWTAILIISGSLSVIGILFLVSWAIGRAPPAGDAGSALQPD